MKLPVELSLSGDENRRRAYRVATHERVTMTIQEQRVRLLDISETGIAFETDQVLSGAIEEAVLLFDVGGRKYRFKPKLNVTFCKRGHCGAEFRKLSEKAHLALSELVVDIQKTEIRAAKAERLVNDGA